MSVNSFLFLRDDQLPTIKQWQEALDLAEADITLGDIDDLRSHSGFFPASYQGAPSGFEWYYDTIEESYGDDLPSEIGDKTHAVTLVTHSDMRELICALIAGGILAKISDGLVLDGETGKLSDGNAWLNEAEEGIRYLSKT
jgi:hypothetical protein